MTRRNLRKWAEAKQRRERPLYGWLDEIQHFGTPVAPPTWLPLALDELVQAKFDISPYLRNLADPPLPYTHTLKSPLTEYDHNGYPLPPRIQPSMTITLLPPNNEDCDPAGAFSRAIEMLMLYDLTPQEVAVAKSAFSQLVADYSAQTLGIGHVQHGQPGDWFRSIRWSAAAWQALHGTDGPRRGWER